MDLLDALRRNVRHRGQSPALISSTETISYAELAQRLAELASGFESRGRRPGDRIGIATYRGAFAAELFLAAQVAGLVPVMLSRGLGPYLFDMARRMGVAEFFCEERVAPGAKTSGAERIWVDENDDGRLRSLIAAPAPEHAVSHWGGRPSYLPTAVQFSAGSTGTPKPILRTVATELWDALNRTIAFRCREGDRWVSASPSNLSVVAGALRPMILVGGTVVALDQLSLTSIDAATRDGVSILPLQQPQWHEVLASPLGGELARRGLRQAIATGQRVPASLLARLGSVVGVGGEVVINYGTSETSTISVARSGDPGFGSPHCVGTPLPTCDVEIVAHDMMRANGATGNGQAGMGEVQVRGPAVSPAYVEDPAVLAQAELLSAGAATRTFSTGDAGCWGADGLLYVYGRINDALALPGGPLFPGVLEEQLGELDGVREAALSAPLRNGRPSDVLRIFIEVEPGAEHDEPSLRAQVETSLADEVKVPIEVEIVASLPRTPGGKLDRRALLRADGFQAITH